MIVFYAVLAGLPALGPAAAVPRPSPGRRGPVHGPAALGSVPWRGSRRGRRRRCAAPAGVHGSRGLTTETLPRTACGRSRSGSDRPTGRCSRGWTSPPTASPPASPCCARPWGWSRPIRRARCATWRTGWPRAGWAALRVDYAATGDSAGTWTDPDLVAGMARAASEAPSTTPAPSGRRGSPWSGSGSAPHWRSPSWPAAAPWTTSCCGTRARRAAASCASSARSGPFLRDQATEWGLLGEGEVWGSGSGAADGATEGPGVVFSAETVAALEPLAIGPVDATWASRELVLARQERKLNRTLEERAVAARRRRRAWSTARTRSSTSPPSHPRRRSIALSHG